jgi:hypothetical protein
MPVVSAVGTATQSRAGLGKKLEIAMAEAAAQAQREGVVDPAVIRDRMIAAREQVKKTKS